MNLRSLAALDHARILSDGVDGFGWPIIVTNPEGVMVVTTGFASDVGEVVDPQTGLAVLGRRVTVQLLPGPIRELAMGEIRAVAEGDRKPWLVRFTDIHNRGRTYKVAAVHPDNDLGSIRVELEAWAAG